MLDIQKIRNNPEEVKNALKKRLYDVDFTELLSWDKERRSIIAESEELKAKRNKISAEIPALKKQGKDISELLADMKNVSDTIKKMDDQLREIEGKINDFLAGLPNIPAEMMWWQAERK